MIILINIRILIIVAFAFPLDYQAQNSNCDIEHSSQVIVVIYRQQVAVFVRVANIKLNAVQAMQMFQFFVEFVEFEIFLTLQSKSSELCIILSSVQTNLENTFERSKRS